MRQESRDLLDDPRFRRLSKENKEVAHIIRKVVDEQLSYLEIRALCDLVEVAIANEEKGVEGIIVEAGCALGGSAIALASAKRKDRIFFVYDVFGMIPPPSERDSSDVHERYKVIISGESVGMGGRRYYGYEENLYAKVQESFAAFGLEVAKNNIHLVKGLYKDTLKIELPVALAHIDCDWYDSVFLCLNRIEPHVVRGGTLIIDDYYSWSGCRKAVDDYFQSKDRKRYKWLRETRLHIVKK